MKNNPVLSWLVPLVGILALAAAAAGLFWQNPGSPFTFTSLQGRAVLMQGWGLYRNDSLFSAGSFRGSDAATLLVCLPLLAASFILYRRASLRGAFLLAGSLAYFLYYAASLALSSAFNSLFLLYILYFSGSLFAFILACSSIDLPSLPQRLAARVPWRATAVFLFIVGSMTALLWLSDVLPALASGQPPAVMGAYTTMVTYVLDLGIIAPVTLVSAVLMLRRSPLGFLGAATMLILLVQVGVTVIGQTIFQVNSGITFSTGVLIGMIGSWVMMGLVAVFFAATLLRCLPPENLNQGRAA